MRIPFSLPSYWSGETVGFFTGLVVRRYGIRILGSPFRGWTTVPYMGFNLRNGVSPGERRPKRLCPSLSVRFDACMSNYATAKLTIDDVEGLGFTPRSRRRSSKWTSRPPEDENFFGRMTSACLVAAIRKAEKVGVTIEETR